MNDVAQRYNAELTRLQRQTVAFESRAIIHTESRPNFLNHVPHHVRRRFARRPRFAR